jgi:hypothetical protein
MVRSSAAARDPATVASREKREKGERRMRRG